MHGEVDWLSARPALLTFSDCFQSGGLCDKLSEITALITDAAKMWTDGENLADLSAFRNMHS